MAALKFTKKYQTYPEYKDSGVEWLGKIPSEWNAKKIASVFDFPKEKVTEDKLEPLSVTYGGIKRQIENAAKVAEGAQRKLVKVGDIAINGRSDRKGAVGVSEFEGGVSLVYNVLRKRNAETDTKYFHYLMRSTLFSEEFYRWGRGIVDDLWTTRESEMKRMFVTIPDYSEQRKIVLYLDEKTALIDQIIEKKKRLIELLREKRAAVINHSLLHASGEFARIKNIAIINPGKGKISSDLAGIVSFVPMEALSETGTLMIQERTLQSVKSGFTRFRNNDVVLAKITPCFENGKAGVMRGLKNGYGFGTTEFLVLRPLERIEPDYLYYTVFSDKFRKLGEVGMKGSAGQKRVTTAFVSNFQLQVPGKDVQRKIVSEIIKKTEVIDLAVINVERSIDYLTEFKSSLISHVVTGKIKV